MVHTLLVWARHLREWLKLYRSNWDDRRESEMRRVCHFIVGEKRARMRSWRYCLCPAGNKTEKTNRKDQRLIRADHVENCPNPVPGRSIGTSLVIDNWNRSVPHIIVVMWLQKAWNKESCGHLLNSGRICIITIAIFFHWHIHTIKCY